MEEKCSRGDRSARFGKEARVHQEQLDGLANLVFAHGHNVIDELVDMFEGNLADRSGAKAVADGLVDLFRIEGNALARFEAGLGVSSKLRLHSDNFHVRLAQ